MTRALIRGIDIAYDDAGQGPVVVLLHGYPFNRSMWRHQAEQLSQTYRVITPDLAGFGESGVRSAPTTMEEMARDVEALLESLSIPSATIGGLSMGGYVALAFYRLFPSRVRALVLADTRAQADTDETKENRAVQAAKALNEGMEGIADSMVPKLVAQETLTKRPDVIGFIRDMMINSSRRGAAAALGGMAQRADQTPYLTQITVPTLMVVGRGDTLTPIKDSELMHRQIKGSRLQIIENAGHVSNIEQPEDFNKALLEFLEKLAA